jgi:hypothetical protein
MIEQLFYQRQTSNPRSARPLSKAC